MAFIAGNVAKQIGRNIASDHLQGQHWVDQRDNTHSGRIPANTTGTQYTPQKSGYYKVQRFSRFSRGHLTGGPSFSGPYALRNTCPQFLTPWYRGAKEGPYDTSVPFINRETYSFRSKDTLRCRRYHAALHIELPQEVLWLRAQNHWLSWEASHG